MSCNEWVADCVRCGQFIPPYEGRRFLDFYYCKACESPINDRFKAFINEPMLNQETKDTLDKSAKGEEVERFDSTKALFEDLFKDLPRCEWAYDPNGYYETSCGNTICIDDSLEGSEYRFCPLCGKEIKELPQA